MTNSSPSASRRNRVVFILAMLAATAFIAFAAVAIYSRVMGNKPYQAPWRHKPTPETRAACAKHIENANTLAAQTIERHAEEFRQFMLARKSGSRAFAEELTSLYGKWRTVKPYLPGTDTDGHKKYVRELFARHLFAESDLGSALRRAIEGSVKDIEGIQNDLAVTLRQEILGAHLAQHDIPIAQQQFRTSINQMVEAAQWDATKAAGNLAVSELVSFVAIQVFTRLGVSTGILAAGAANSWWSFGAAIVIGVAVDALWTWIDDPVGDIDREVRAALDNTANKGKRALSEELTKVLTEKTTLWKSATEEMLEEAK